MTTAFRWLRDRYLIVTAVSGVILITMGVLLFTGELAQLNIEAQNALDDLGLNFFKSRLGPSASGPSSSGGSGR